MKRFLTRNAWPLALLLAILLQRPLELQAQTAFSFVTGTVASLSADAGNPVKVGCVRNTSAPSPANGQRVDCQADASGNLMTADQNPVAQASTTSGQKGPLTQCAATTGVPSYTTAQTDPLSCNLAGGLRTSNQDASGNLTPAGDAAARAVSVNLGTGGTALPTAAALSDAVANPTTTQLGASQELWDNAGSQWVRQPANGSGIVAIASGTYSSTQTQGDQTNFGWRGIQCVLNATAVVSTGSFTLEIDSKDSVSGTYTALLTGAAVSTVSTNVYTVYPGNTVAANASVSTFLPRIWRVKAVYNSGTSLTFSVGCNPEV